MKADDRDRPLAIDLYCHSRRMVKYSHYGHKGRQGPLGARAEAATQARALPTEARRKATKARRNQIAGTSILAVDDDSVCVERPRASRLSPLPRQGDNRLRAMAGVCELSCRHGSEAHTQAFDRSNRFGRQL